MQGANTDYLKIYDKELKLYAYHHMGKAYQHMKEYQSAITCFKKVLQLSWLIGDKVGEKAEMEAYENLGLQYFYLGQTEKSLFYSDRMMKGKFEAKFSIIRKTYL